jgi:hypothetical protein
MDRYVIVGRRKGRLVEAFLSDAERSITEQAAVRIRSRQQVDGADSNNVFEDSRDDPRLSEHDNKPLRAHSRILALADDPAVRRVGRRVLLRPGDRPSQARVPLKRQDQRSRMTGAFLVSGSASGLFGAASRSRRSGVRSTSRRTSCCTPPRVFSWPSDSATACRLGLSASRRGALTRRPVAARCLERVRRPNDPPRR